MPNPTGPGFPIASNTYVPSFASSGRLVVGFSRNAKKFPLPNYLQIVKTPREYGYYLQITPNVAARVVNQRDFAFPDSQPRPQPDGQELFNFEQFRTHRWSYGFALGELATEQADWNIVEAHAQIAAARAMTARTNRVATVLTSSGNWPSTHTSSATSLAGGKWDVGTGTNPYIHLGLNKMAIQIGLDTRSTVSPQDLVLICNPNVAAKMSVAPEIQAYLANSYWAKKEIEEGIGPNSRYGLPETLYGYKFIVDDTVVVTTLENTDSVNYAATGTYAYPDETVVMVSRPGGIEGVYGSPSFSTITLFAYEEFSMERFENRRDRMVESFVTENTAEILTAPISGYLLTAVTS